MYSVSALFGRCDRHPCHRGLKGIVDIYVCTAQACTRYTVDECLRTSLRKTYVSLVFKESHKAITLRILSRAQRSADIRYNIGVDDRTIDGPVGAIRRLFCFQSAAWVLSHESLFLPDACLTLSGTALLGRDPRADRA